MGEGQSWLEQSIIKVDNRLSQLLLNKMDKNKPKRHENLAKIQGLRKEHMYIFTTIKKRNKQA